MNTENAMGTKPVFPLLLGMSLPPMVSMLIQSMYNVVDSIYLANYSKEALTAVSLVFPLQNLVLAVGVGFGIGINSCLSRSLGEKNKSEADRIAAHGVICTFFHALLFLIVGLFLSKPFIGMFTANPSIYEMGCEYSVIVICMSFGSLFHILIEKIFQSVGNMVAPMFLQAAGALINIILDPILIFGYFGLPAMGIRGAAVATIIGQLAACSLSVIMFIRSHTGVNIRFKGFHLNGAVLKKIYGVGVPAGMMVALPSVMVGILNGILTAFSEAAVAVLGVYIKLQSFVYMPSNGVIQGLRPIVGYCYGAKKYDRIEKVIRCSLGMIAVILAAGTALFIAGPELIMGLFKADEEMMGIGTEALRIIAMGFLISTISLVYSGTFEGLGNGFASLVINMIRQFLVIPPLALVLTPVFGVTGVWLAFPIAEALAAVISIILYRSKIKNRILNRAAGQTRE